MSDLMTFPETWEEFERSYGFNDKDEVYTNGSRLIQSFRVKQWLEHMKTADAVQVVRCRDCKHFMPYTGEEALIVPYKDTDGWCHQGYPRAMDFFCAGGERRTE